MRDVFQKNFHFEIEYEIKFGFIVSQMRWNVMEFNNISFDSRFCDALKYQKFIHSIVVIALSLSLILIHCREWVILRLRSCVVFRTVFFLKRKI